MKNLFSSIMLLTCFTAFSQEPEKPNRDLVREQDSTAVAETDFSETESPVHTIDPNDESADNFNGTSHFVDGKEIKCYRKHQYFFIPIKKIQKDQLAKALNGTTF